MSTERSSKPSHLTSSSFETLEKPMRLGLTKNELFIGLPRERQFQERRVSLTPRAVRLLVNNGHQVWIEQGAGEKSFYTDQDYSDAGARIVYETEEVFKAHIILKIGPLPPDQLDFMKPNQTLISALHLPALSEQYIKTLLKKGITAIAYEYLRDSSGGLPVVRSMGEIAGTTAILIGAEYLADAKIGRGKLLGGIIGLPPTRVVILGAGTVGEFAARTAIGLGADVKVFDNSLYKLRRLQSELNTRIFTSIIEPAVLNKELYQADVVIGAVGPSSGRTPMLVPEKVVTKMRAGAVIVDVSIDHGGCFETSEVTTHDNPVFVKHDVIHYCVPNIPSRVCKSASKALSNVLAPILIEAANNGGIEEQLWYEKGLRSGTYIYKNSCTNRYLSQRYGLNFTNLELLAAARRS